MTRAVTIGILLLSLIGLADSLYLAKHKADGTPLICDIDGLSGCNIVADSQYSDIFGIPLAEFGIGFYALILFLVLARSYVALRGVASIGTLASLYFIFVQVFLIKALCIYCIASALCTFIILFLSSRPPRREVLSTEEAPLSP